MSNLIYVPLNILGGIVVIVSVNVATCYSVMQVPGSFLSSHFTDAVKVLLV